MFGVNLPYSAKFSRIHNFQNFTETIFADAIHVTLNEHNYMKIFTNKMFEVGDRSSLSKPISLFFKFYTIILLMLLSL